MIQAVHRKKGSEYFRAQVDNTREDTKSKFRSQELYPVKVKANRFFQEQATQRHDLLCIQEADTPIVCTCCVRNSRAGSRSSICLLLDHQEHRLWEQPKLYVVTGELHCKKHTCASSSSSSSSSDIHSSSSRRLVLQPQSRQL